MLSLLILLWTKFEQTQSENYCFNSSLEGWRLNEPVILKTDAQSETECILSCVKTPCCRSINYRIGFNQSCGNEGNKDRCEMLHSIHDKNDCSKLERNTKYNYVLLISPKKSFNRTCIERKECLNSKALGMESGEISDLQITASSVFSNKSKFRGLNARLNSDNSWLSGKANHKQWLQVNFKKRASEFDGNSDIDTIVRQEVSPVIVCHYIRIHPISWQKDISMRLEFVGCFSCA
ncbi:EGF-like repeat and discoidin I-like domain-containing protein 3 isoform X2 [Xenia sp. Carnegie-2017]|uniref:EGF-like repeat and discoidin I-like domain-containing protein 3 isoform X2 n=1 Tax=Xenia sp. Carnegie-2017 TaxID=2897299 RepID=UPI001F03DC2C|nr:EGF-like repeat and discoidin I-like domain-containing protein 3 isoform X2 [Xenia sp. Carnegie-2017]